MPAAYSSLLQPEHVTKKCSALSISTRAMPSVPPAEFAARLPQHAMSACVLITDTQDRVLMLHQARA